MIIDKIFFSFLIKRKVFVSIPMSSEDHFFSFEESSSFDAIEKDSFSDQESKIFPEDCVLTGDRPTGPLHLGHYVGSLKLRLQTQEICQKQFIIVADLQALTDNIGQVEKVHKNTLEVVKDYLAVGLDPEKSIFFLQSLVPELTELTFYFMNFVTLSRLRRNPTIKAEALQKGYGENIRMGFLTYPISQAADILGLGGTLVPVGKDQAPMIEQTNEIVDSFQNLFGQDSYGHEKKIFSYCRALYSETPRLIGFDGKEKASKSLNNAISLAEDPESLWDKIRRMPTDPNHIYADQPGCIENNVVFTYLDSFYEDKAHLKKLKDHYTRGGLGDLSLKKLLHETLEALIKPIREKRDHISDEEAWNCLKKGTLKARAVASDVLMKVRSAMGFIGLED